MEYKKIDLDYNSLDPYIDDKTLYLHYNAHYNGYTDNLNKYLIFKLYFKKPTTFNLYLNILFNIKRGVHELNHNMKILYISCLNPK